MKRFVGLLGLAVFVVAATASSALANHSWSTYHWARTANPFTIKVGDNMTTADWKSHLSQASSDWNQSTVAKNTIVSGASTGKGRKCRATLGRVEVCNASYGNNGWLGLATIWLSGGHIAQGTTQVNDTYFNTSTYNNPNEKQHVICQEIGHTWGLDHQDESGALYYTCMDYFSNTGANAGNSASTTPNRGDYDQLLCIYDPASNGATLSSTTNGRAHTCVGTGHLDSSSTIGAAAGSASAEGAQPPAWANPSESVYVDHLPNGQTQVTYVRWANPIHSWGG
jgi:hypothetical protein